MILGLHEFRLLKKGGWVIGYHLGLSDGSDGRLLISIGLLDALLVDGAFRFKYFSISTIKLTLTNEITTKEY